jgi:hypothetical protein
VDNITAQLKDGVPGHESNQTGPQSGDRFLGVEGCQPAEIHRQMNAIYGAARVPRSRINVQVNSLTASLSCMLMPTPCISQSSGQTKCHAIEGAQTTSIQSGHIAIHISGPLKKAFKGCTFLPDDNVQKAVIEWFRQQPKEFFANRICQLVHQWDFCLNACGDFF